MDSNGDILGQNTRPCMMITGKNEQLHPPVHMMFSYAAMLVVKEWIS